MDQSQDDGLKWFGEGFDGFPKRLPEDCVEYSIRIINSKLSDIQVREELGNVERAASQLSKELLEGYIWQRDAFVLSLARDNESWILHGRTNFGDSVADEWLIVSLLRDISRKFEDAWIRVYDTDGEFLLIEAANALPRWLNPEIAQNRVWLRDGKLLIVPLHQSLTPQKKNNPIKKSLSISEALLFITSDPSKMTHSPLVEEEAFYRIRNHPSQIKDNLHNAALSIPRKLAYILNQNSTYSSAAVEAFYLRDPISLRSLNKNDVSALTFPPEDFVSMTVRFNKVGYAQLYSQNFMAPKPWEVWLSSLDNDAELKRREVAMKLTCGFEMLLKDPQNQDKRAVREIKLFLEDIANGDEELPSDLEIKTRAVEEDDDGWLDIDLDNLEDELKGKEGDRTHTTRGFGDEATQENLRKMVERFEDFLNNDDSDDMDENDEDEDDESDEGEDREVSFDEEEFMRMMTEMMGLPLGAGGGTGQDKAELGTALGALADFKVTDSHVVDAEDDAEEICMLSEQMEAELNAARARLDSVVASEARSAHLSKAGESSRGQPTSNGKGKQRVVEANNDKIDLLEQGEEEREGSDIEIDFDLANNLLKSLQSSIGLKKTMETTSKDAE